mgnify:CR=1 FL=1
MRLCIYFQRDTKKQEKDTRTRETRSGHIPRARPLSSARAAILPFLLFLVEIGGLSQAIETLEKSHFKVLCISVFFFRFFSLQLSLMCDFAVVVIFTLAALRFIIKEHGSEYAVRAGPVKQLWLLAESLASKRESLGKA